MDGGQCQGKELFLNILFCDVFRRCQGGLSSLDLTRNIMFWPSYGTQKFDLHAIGPSSQGLRIYSTSLTWTSVKWAQNDWDIEAYM